MSAKKHWLDDPKNIRLLWRGFLAILALTVIAGFMTDLHPHFEIEALPGFNAIYGFTICLLMIVAAKLLGMLIKRRDDYYREDHKDD